MKDEAKHHPRKSRQRDGITTGHFAKDSQNRLLAVKEHLKEGTWQPKPVKRVMMVR